MNYRLVKLAKENDLNRELRKQKKERGDLSILFVSPWDPYCKTLMEKLERKAEKAPDTAPPLYIVDNYNMPHSFVIFNSTMLPHFVRIKRNKVMGEDYLPFIYNKLGLE